MIMNNVIKSIIMSGYIYKMWDCLTIKSDTNTSKPHYAIALKNIDDDRSNTGFDMIPFSIITSNINIGKYPIPVPFIDHVSFIIPDNIHLLKSSTVNTHKCIFKGIYSINDLIQLNDLIRMIYDLNRLCAIPNLLTRDETYDIVKKYVQYVNKFIHYGRINFSKSYTDSDTIDNIAAHLSKVIDPLCKEFEIANIIVAEKDHPTNSDDNHYGDDGINISVNKSNISEDNNSDNISNHSGITTENIKYSRLRIYAHKSVKNLTIEEMRYYLNCVNNMKGTDMAKCIFGNESNVKEIYRLTKRIRSRYKAMKH